MLNILKSFLAFVATKCLKDSLENQGLDLYTQFLSHVAYSLPRTSSIMKNYCTKFRLLKLCNRTQSRVIYYATNKRKNENLVNVIWEIGREVPGSGPVGAVAQIC